MDDLSLEQGDVAAIVRRAIEEFSQRDQTQNDAALQEERRLRGELERRLNEVVEENRREQDASAIRAELQRLGVAKVDLLFKAVREDIVRTEDGRLVGRVDGAEVGVKEFLANFVSANPEFLPARISGGSGVTAGQKAPAGGGGGVDIDRIKPGMSREEMERVRQEIIRLSHPRAQF